MTKESNDREFEETPPDPASTIESLRALGYSPESAIADLIDNSIAAGGRMIEVKLHWAGANGSWCWVMDDGRGMTEEELRVAMRIGSGDPLADRVAGDLGRFGFGLKTASFSQCRELTVVSKNERASRAHVRCWDLDHVRRVGRWELRRSAPPEVDRILRTLPDRRTGTIVIWRRLDVLVESDAEVNDTSARKAFLERMTHIERHLGMTFERFLRRGDPIKIRLNGHPIRAWDPFVSEHEATQSLPPEKLSLKHQAVLVSPYVLPHRSKFVESAFDEAGGPLGWNAQQGFYVYRGDRLITSGDWLGLGFTRDDSHNLARIAVDVPVELDLAWSLDVTKASVRPPTGLRNDLKRIAGETRRRAKRVLTHRGATVGDHRVRTVVPVWHQRRKHGELAFRLNRKHPLIEGLLRSAIGDLNRSLSDLLYVIEETIPVLALPAKAKTPPRLALEGSPPDEVMELAAKLYESFLRQGLSRAQAVERLLHTEPFNQYSDIVGRLTESL